MTNPFSSLQQFRQQFNQGLHQLLDKQQLGTFILCLANATNDESLFEQLKLPLENQFKLLLAEYQLALKSGVQINAVEEDLLVFLKLHTLGFDQIKLTQLRDESHWLCQFNQLRSFRPKRITNFLHNGEMSTPFVENQFHFNKPFMAKECFWSGDYHGKPLDLFYNKYPFADLHGLIVPQREACLPQFLLKDMHDYIWDITRQLSTGLPGIAMGYNSYGAYASVNHLHFQMFINPQGLPISHQQWNHNGGSLQYPLNVYAFTNGSDSWKKINDLHENKQAYNLLFMPDKIFIIPRMVQGSVEVPLWSSGLTWYELSGAILLFNQQHYFDLTDTHIENILEANCVKNNFLK